MWEAVADHLFLAGVTAYTFLGMGYVLVMWNLRHDFFIALRSPRLACGVGLCFFMCLFIFTLEFFVACEGRYPTFAGVTSLISQPIILLAEGWAIMRAVRLLLMYFPDKRKKWGRIPKEMPILLCGVSSYVLTEIAVWSAAGVHGITPAGNMTKNVVTPLSVVTGIIASIGLGRELLKVDDLGKMGHESLQIAACITGTVVIYVAIKAVPSHPVTSKYAHVVFSIVLYAPAVWLLNIKPIRDFLRQFEHAASAQAGYHLVYGIIPWRHQIVQVVVGSERRSRRNLVSTNNCRSEGPLGDIMGFLPLKGAFGEFCRKALCSESFNFLVDVSEFKNTVYSAVDSHGVTKEAALGEDFDRYLAIIREYIEASSVSEVNIECHTRHKVLLYVEQKDKFIELIRDDRVEIFLLAEREISQMLADNLLNKFRVSAPYKELVDGDGGQLEQG